MLLSEKVKITTAAVHKELEAATESQKIFDRTYTLQQYGKMMQNNYLFCAAIEKYFVAYQQNFVHLHLPQRRKCKYLIDDLQELQINVPETVHELIINSAAEFLGALYVAEGAMLGGQVIKKQLQQNPAFINYEAFRYYTCYGDNLRNRWIEFLEVLNNFGETHPYEIENVLEGAITGFNFYKGLAVSTAEAAPVTN